MPDHPLGGILVGSALSVVFAVSIWTVADSRAPRFRRQLVGFLGAVAIGLAFYAGTEADPEWIGLLGIVWVVTTFGLRLGNCFHLRLINTRFASALTGQKPSQVSTLEWFVLAAVIAFSLAVFIRILPHPGFVNFLSAFRCFHGCHMLGNGAGYAVGFSVCR